MAELAGLTAIRAASVKQAPTLKKFKKITETPLPDKQLEEFREILEVKREQLVGDVSSMEKEALGGDGGSLSRLPQHMADQGTDTYDQSLNLDLAASQRGIVKEIDAALDRIVNRTFGVCELLGKPIGIDRLRNAPWTRYSIEAARMLELNPELARVGGGNGDGGDSEDDDNDDDV
jgi:DnaK suppressor protein